MKKFIATFVAFTFLFGFAVALQAAEVNGTAKEGKNATGAVDIEGPKGGILYYLDSAQGSPVFQPALEGLGLWPLVTFTSDSTTFANHLATGGWDLVIGMQQWYGGVQPHDAPLATYASAGNPVIYADWRLRFTDYSALYAAFDASYTGTINETSITTSGHPIYAGITSPMSIINPGYGCYAVSLDTATGGLGEGTFPSGLDAVIVGNSGMTLLNGPMSDTFGDLAQGILFAQNEINFLMDAEPVFYLDMDASYAPGDLDLEFTIGAPSACTWVTLLILTQPSVQVIPLFAIPLPAISPPVTIPLSLPIPELGTIVIFTALFTTALEVKDFEVIQTTLGDVVFDTSVGTGAPPATLGGYSMTPVPYPGAPACTGIQPPLPTPGGTLDIAPVDSSMARCIGPWPAGWMSWSHGYVGDVYYTGGALSQTFTLPPSTSAFYLYVEPNPFSEHTFEVVAEPGGFSSGEFTANGSAGAAYCGVYDSTGGAISSVTITCTTSVDFATGEFGWSD